MIDSHVHIGKYGPWESDVELLIEQMKQFGITQALASDMGINTYGIDGKLLHPDMSQIELNDIAFSKIKPYSSRLKLLFWIRPSIDSVNMELVSYLKDNSEFLGLKVHPKTAGLVFSEDNYLEYITICEQLHLPFCIHTENDGFSNIEFVYEVARKHPYVVFVAVHMNLGTNHEEALQYIKNCRNLYGDTTLVDVSDVLKAIEVCGSDKILFGSDACIFGDKSYSRYENLFQEIAQRFGTEAAENVFCRNAAKLFGR